MDNAEAGVSLIWAHMPFCWFSHEAAHLGMQSFECNYSMAECPGIKHDLCF